MIKFLRFLYSEGLRSLLEAQAWTEKLKLYYSHLYEEITEEV